METTNDKIIAQNKRLIQQYPFLLPRNVWTDRVDEDYDYSYTLADAVPEGWLTAFGNQMWQDLYDILAKASYVNEFRFIQIKEKWGELCLYSNGVPLEIEAEYYRWEEKYVKLSSKTCIICGKSATTQTQGWIMPVCDDCYNKLLMDRQKGFQSAMRQLSDNVTYLISDVVDSVYPFTYDVDTLTVQVDFVYNFSGQYYKTIEVFDPNYSYRATMTLTKTELDLFKSVTAGDLNVAFHDWLKDFCRSAALEQAAYETIAAEADATIC